MDIGSLFGDRNIPATVSTIGSTDTLDALPIAHGQVSDLGKMAVGMEASRAGIAAEKDSILLANEAALGEENWSAVALLGFAIIGGGIALRRAGLPSWNIC